MAVNVGPGLAGFSSRQPPNARVGDKGGSVATFIGQKIVEPAAQWFTTRTYVPVVGHLGYQFGPGGPLELVGNAVRTGPAAVAPWVAGAAVAGAIGGPALAAGVLGAGALSAYQALNAPGDAAGAASRRQPFNFHGYHYGIESLERGRENPYIAGPPQNGTWSSWYYGPQINAFPP